jgi:hypothetical protein
MRLGPPIHAPDSPVVLDRIEFVLDCAPRRYAAPNTF